MHTKTLKAYWRDLDVRPEVGRGILVDGWGTHCPSYLEPCELPGLAPFRLPSGRYLDVKYACRVEFTGRAAQKRPYDDWLWVRVRIVFADDVESDTEARGWMTVWEDHHAYRPLERRDRPRRLRPGRQPVRVPDRYLPTGHPQLGPGPTHREVAHL
jgi:hypothetical protein